MNTHESYVSLKTDALLKQAGFDWYEKDLPEYSIFTVPTLAVAQRWLREVKGYILEITAVRKNPDDAYKTYIEYWYNIFEKGKCGHCDTYEQAQEAGIQKCLTILLEN